MPELNPYASPHTAADAELRSDGRVGAWRQGEFLVMHRAAILPPVCVFTGEPTDGGVMRFDFTGPGDKHSLRLVLERVDAVVMLPVKAEIRASYWWKSGLLYGGVATGAVLAISGAATLRGGLLIPALLCFPGAVAAFLAAGYATLTRPTLTVYDIDYRYVWIRGVSPDCLKHLPEWPFEPA